jgi:glucosylglycerate phosphorylase
MTPDNAQTIGELALAIFPAQGETATARILDLVIQHQDPHRRGRYLPGPEEVILITYGDQIQTPGEAPLQTLLRFCRERAPFIPTLHLLPFFPYSSDDGFSVIDYQSVDPAMGDWNDITALAGQVRLMFDAVVNHISAQSPWFAGYLAGTEPYQRLALEVDPRADMSSVVRPRTLPLLTEFETHAGRKHLWTTFSADQIDLNYADLDVFVLVLDVLLFYVERGASLIRLDAIAFVWKELGTSCMSLPTTHRIVQLMRAVLDAVAPQVAIITETNVPHEENISYFGDGHNEAQLVYNFALPPLVLHTLGTGDATALQRWTETLSTPSDTCWFFNFLASHDGVGLRGVESILTAKERRTLAERTLAHGGRVGYRSLPDGTSDPYELNINFFDALSDPAGHEPIETQVLRFLCAHSIMLAMPGVPGLYAHSLLGSRSDTEAVARTGVNRAINREKLRLDKLLAELNDANSLRSRVFTGLRQLLTVRADCAELAPGTSHEVLQTQPELFAVRRANGLTCIHNVTAVPQRLSHGGVDALSGTRLCPGDQIGGYAVVWLR